MVWCNSERTQVAAGKYNKLIEKEKLHVTFWLYRYSVSSGSRWWNANRSYWVSNAEFTGWMRRLLYRALKIPVCANYVVWPLLVVTCSAAGKTGEVGIRSTFPILADKVSVEKLFADQEKSTIAFLWGWHQWCLMLSRGDIGIAIEHLDQFGRLRAAVPCLMDDDPAQIFRPWLSQSACHGLYVKICFAIGIKLLCLFW